MMLRIRSVQRFCLLKAHRLSYRRYLSVCQMVPQSSLQLILSVAGAAESMRGWGGQLRVAGGGGRVRGDKLYMNSILDHFIRRQTHQNLQKKKLKGWEIKKGQLIKKKFRVDQDVKNTENNQKQESTDKTSRLQSQ